MVIRFIVISLSKKVGQIASLKSWSKFLFLINNELGYTHLWLDRWNFIRVRGICFVFLSPTLQLRLRLHLDHTCFMSVLSKLWRSLIFSSSSYLRSIVKMMLYLLMRYNISRTSWQVLMLGLVNKYVISHIQ